MMKLKTYIIEDHHREYDEIKSMLLEFDFIEVIGNYISEQPYEEALQYVNREYPELLIIDFDLGHGSGKTGEILFKSISEYKCFAIFCSRLPEAVNSQTGFMNSKFIRKQLDPILSRSALSNALNLAKEFLQDETYLSLKFYRSGASTGRISDNFREETILCKNLVRLIGEGKKYSYVYYADGKFVERVGPASKGVGVIVDQILNSGYDDYEVHSSNPYILVNKTYFDRNPKNKEYSLKDSFNSEKRFRFS